MHQNDGMMNQLTNEDHMKLMADMKAFDEQMPCIGIFWYDPEGKSLFDVRKKEITPKMVEEAADKGVPFIDYPLLHNNYPQMPGGRVARNIDKFIALVGHWAEPILNELTTLIEEEFSLPYFEFVYDEHWNPSGL